MASKVKLTENTELANKAKLIRPPAWEMDPHVCNLLERLDPKSKIAIQISLLMLEYDKKCAQAKIDLFNKIMKLMNPLKKK